MDGTRPARRSASLSSLARKVQVSKEESCGLTIIPLNPTLHHHKLKDIPNNRVSRQLAFRFRLDAVCAERGVSQLSTLAWGGEEGSGREEERKRWR